jgi:hypothetical protein
MGNDRFPSMRSRLHHGDAKLLDRDRDRDQHGPSCCVQFDPIRVDKMIGRSRCNDASQIDRFKSNRSIRLEGHIHSLNLEDGRICVYARWTTHVHRGSAWKRPMVEGGPAAAVMATVGAVNTAYAHRPHRGRGRRVGGGAIDTNARIETVASAS